MERKPPKPKPRRFAVEESPDFEFYHPTDPRFEGGRPVRKKLLYTMWLEDQREKLDKAAETERRADGEVPEGAAVDSVRRDGAAVPEDDGAGNL
jgi:hypothetical protein